MAECFCIVWELYSVLCAPLCKPKVSPCLLTADFAPASMTWVFCALFGAAFHGPASGRQAPLPTAAGTCRAIQGIRPLCEACQDTTYLETLLQILLH